MTDLPSAFQAVDVHAFAAPDSQRTLMLACLSGWASAPSRVTDADAAAHALCDDAAGHGPGRAARSFMRIAPSGRGASGRADAAGGAPHGDRGRLGVLGNATVQVVGTARDGRTLCLRPAPS